MCIFRGMTTTLKVGLVAGWSANHRYIIILNTVPEAGSSP